MTTRTPSQMRKAAALAAALSSIPRTDRALRDRPAHLNQDDRFCMRADRVLYEPYASFGVHDPEIGAEGNAPDVRLAIAWRHEVYRASREPARDDECHQRVELVLQ